VTPAPAWHVTAGREDKLSLCAQRLKMQRKKASGSCFVDIFAKFMSHVCYTAPGPTQMTVSWLVVNPVFAQYKT
jgi:hypothetical protein